MNAKATLLCSVTAALVTAATSLPAAAQFVTIGNPGNPNDQNYGPGAFGAVATTYAIGTFEVTISQYTAFLNAVAATDTYNLYNPAMASDLHIAGISRMGSPGGFAYAVIGSSGNKPVTYVSFYDAMRYVNWLGTGNTETGAYTLLGGTAVPMNGATVTRNVAAQYWIPSLNEWYKAAYYQPAANGGDTDGYWLYPTGTNSIPGNVIGASPNRVNYYSGVYSVTQLATRSDSQSYLTEVGACSGSASYYGTFDQGGNVWEWNDTLFGSSRSRRGGSWNYFEDNLRASYQLISPPQVENDYVGFRVATVPEPSSTVLMCSASLLALARRRRRAAL